MIEVVSTLYPVTELGHLHFAALSKEEKQSRHQGYYNIFSGKGDGKCRRANGAVTAFSVIDVLSLRTPE